MIDLYTMDRMRSIQLEKHLEDGIKDELELIQPEPYKSSIEGLYYLATMRMGGL